MEFELVVFYVTLYAVLEFAYLKLSGPAYAANFRVVQGSPPDYKLEWAIAAYIVLFIVVYYFVIDRIFRPSRISELPSVAHVATQATLLALAIYGVYNLTNLATLKGYGVGIAIRDTVWGVAALNAVALGCYLMKRLSLR